MISDSCLKLGKGGDGPVRLLEVHITVTLLLATVLRLKFYQSDLQLAENIAADCPELCHFFLH